MSVVALDHYQFLRVSGADTFSFLQGQLSCDMDELSPTRSLRGVICNLKGRVVAEFRIVQDGDDCVIQTGAGSADKIMQTLAKYAVFSKVKLNIDNDVRALGLLSPSYQEQIKAVFGELPEPVEAVASGDAALLINIPGAAQRYELWLKGQQTLAALLPDVESPSLSTSTSSIEEWARQDILAGIAHLSSEQSESFTPQLLNYDISGAVSFTKGCYTGQEVVARMYYRGTAKKRLYIVSSNLSFNAEDAIEQSLKGSTKQAEIVQYANSASENGDSVALAILDTASMAAGATLSLSTNEQAQLELVELPYSDNRE